MGSLPVATSTTNLLHVTLKVARHVVMNDSMYILLVKSHTKSHSCNHDAQAAVHEVQLDTLTCCS